MAAVTTTTAQFTVPAVGSTVNIDIGDTAWLVAGSKLIIETAGSFDVTSITNATRFVGRNLGYSINASPTTVIASGVDVNPGDISGQEPMNGYGAHSATTTKGDLLADNGANAPRPNLVRKAVGTNGQALVADSTQATGLNYTTITPNSTTDNGIPRYDGTSGTPVPLQTSNLLITDTGAIQSTPSGGNARGTSAVDLQVTRGAGAQVASGTTSVIGGGTSNTSSGTSSTVSGGQSNAASGNNSVIAGGSNCQASGLAATVGGGQSNSTLAANGTVSGGVSNSMASSGVAATIGGGNTNAADGQFSTIGGGSNNIIGSSAEGATIAGGVGNTASEVYTTVWGSGAAADKYGQSSHASGGFATAGDAQTSELIFRISTTNATPTEMFLNGATATERAVIAINTAWVFNGYCAVREDATGDTKALSFSGVLKRNGTTTTALVAAVSPSTVAADAGAATWTLAVTADNANESLKLEVTGEAAHTLRWVAWVRLVEVSG